MAVVDEGGGGPTLDPKAKHYERQLFKVFSSSTSTIWLTQDDWKGAKTQVENLAKDVGRVRTELEAPADGSRGWTGPAAQAALSTLEKLGTTLDGHAARLGEVDTSLGQVYKAINDAKSGWYSEVASISTHVDPADHRRLPAPSLPTPHNTAASRAPSPGAAAGAEDAKWEQRNQAAKRVLDQLAADTQTATATMPIDSKSDTETPYSDPGPGGGGGDYPTGTTTPSTSGGYEGAVRPTFTGGLVSVDHTTTNTGDNDDPIVVQPEPEPEPEVTIGDPEPPEPDRDLDLDPDLDPISSDGDVTGTVGNGPTGGPTTAGSQAMGGGGGGGGGSMGGGGLAAGGLGAGAAGLGGLLRARGGLGGMGGGAVSNGGRGATSGGRPGGAAGGRGGAALTSGGARGGSQMVPGGGAQSRGGASGRGGSAVKGASGQGRYGVPKLDGTKGAGRNGGAAAGSGQASRSGGRGAPAKGASGRGGGVGAGSAGGSRKGDKAQTTDVDKLTHEDEDAWYDGTDESSPQVWD